MNFRIESLEALWIKMVDCYSKSGSSEVTDVSDARHSIIETGDVTGPIPDICFRYPRSRSANGTIETVGQSDTRASGAVFSPEGNENRTGKPRRGQNGENDVIRTVLQKPGFLSAPPEWGLAS